MWSISHLWHFRPQHPSGSTESETERTLLSKESPSCDFGAILLFFFKAQNEVYRKQEFGLAIVVAVLLEFS